MVLVAFQAVTNAENTVFAAKRLIGRSYDDDATQKDKKVLPYQAVKGLPTPRSRFEAI